MEEFTLRGGSNGGVEVELEVRRSRFSCRLARIVDETGAQTALTHARKAHPSAGHHCSAFIVGPAASPHQIRRAHDDGEPSGTAGRPMLEVLEGAQLIDCIAVVSRHFGGTLLGTGGLIRAYSDAVSQAIEQAHSAHKLVSRQLRQLFTVTLDHADAGRVEAELRQRQVTVLGTDYGPSAILTVAVAKERSSALLHAIADVTAGRSLGLPAGEEWIDVEL